MMLGRGEKVFTVSAGAARGGERAALAGAEVSAGSARAARVCASPAADGAESALILGDDAPLPYLLALPPGRPARAPLLVSVHGVTRRPLEHALAFAAPARAAGMALLVPLFAEHGHRRYAQLAHPRSGRRSDLALILKTAVGDPTRTLESKQWRGSPRFSGNCGAVTFWVTASCQKPRYAAPTWVCDRPATAVSRLIETVQLVRARHGLDDGPWHVFGFSAGAQFAHRFALAHPQRVAALAVGAAGWYTWPDTQRPWPEGLAGVEGWLGRAVDLPAFLRLPVAVWVGERDTQRDAALRSTPQLDAWQGASRMERARRWVQALRAVAQAHALPANAALRIVARSGHDFAQCARRGALAASVVEFLFAVLPCHDSVASSMVGNCVLA